MAIYRLHSDWSSLGPFLLCIWPNSIVSCTSRHRFISPISQYTAHCLACRLYFSYMQNSMWDQVPLRRIYFLSYRTIFFLLIYLIFFLSFAFLFFCCLLLIFQWTIFLACILSFFFFSPILFLFLIYNLVVFLLYFLFLFFFY